MTVLCQQKKEGGRTRLVGVDWWLPSSQSFLWTIGADSEGEKGPQVQRESSMWKAMLVQC